MTTEEAIKSALAKVKSQKENFGFMDRFNVDENYVVAEALEKQIPKKTIYSKYGNRDSCPRCNEIINYRIDNYCHRCGQKIDFGVVKNEEE